MNIFLHRYKHKLLKNFYARIIHIIYIIVNKICMNNSIKIQYVSANIAETICRKIIKDLPEYFGLPECNENYAQGVKEHTNFALKINGNWVGLISLSFPYSNAGQIYWMGILKSHHHQGLGRLLVQECVSFAIKKDAKFLTVETLAPKIIDENYSKTYNFYKSLGFEPLFDLKPDAYEWPMVYMGLTLNTADFRSTRKPFLVRQLQESDISLIVDSFAAHNWQKPSTLFVKYLQEQELGTRFVWVAFDGEKLAGYVTLTKKSLYEPFLLNGIFEINDLNVLPPFRNQGIGSALIDIAEKQAFKEHDIVGIGVGLYHDYGSAQKIYISRGYKPDGMGVTYNYQSIEPGKMVCLDDDLVLWFTKKK